MLRTLPIVLFLIIVGSATTAAATPPTHDLEATNEKRHLLSTSLFMLLNLVPDDEPPSFLQLNYGYRLTPTDTISIEAITWQYYGPLGVQWWEKDQANTRYPGKVRNFGVGLAYQRFLWKGAYAALHATPFVQQYHDEHGVIQTGFQLFVALRAGYHFRFFDDRFFIEPSVAVTTWPINTHLPDDFASIEKQWAKFFLFEPGLHAGINF